MINSKYLKGIFMPRKSTQHYISAIYHVMMHGNFRNNIFLNHRHKKRFEFHLVVEIDKIPLVKVMQSLAANYSRELNKNFNRTELKSRLSVSATDVRDN
jgi:hypothetical protein